MVHKKNVATAWTQVSQLRNGEFPVVSKLKCPLFVACEVSGC